MRWRGMIGVAGALAAALLAAPSNSVGQSGSVLVVGDSLAVGGEAYLEAELASTTVTTNAEIGRGSPAGVAALADEIDPSHEIVVFALGSNDGSPDVLASSLAQAEALAAGRCLVVSTVALQTEDDEFLPSVAPLNQVLRAFAAANSNVRLVDWRAAIAADPSLLFDGAHATPEGYALRAALLAQAIASCDGPAASSGFGGDGIPNPDPDALAEGRTRPKREPKPEREPAPKPDPISRDEALEILADSVSSQIAIGSLGAGQ
jgi:lysophospholipase L1-like esterase